MLKFLIAAVLLNISLCAQGSEQTTKIAKFFDAGGRAEHGISRAILDLKQRDPQQAAVLNEVLPSFNQDEFAARIGTLFEDFLTADDINSILRFAETPIGKYYAAAFKIKDPAALAARLGELRGPERQAALEFQNSATFTKLMDAMRSDRARKLAKDYWEELSCAHHVRKDPKALPALRAQGQCLTLKK